jgi:6-phosphogluconolactonase (cycloisomerase 2 family)
MKRIVTLLVAMGAALGLVALAAPSAGADQPLPPAAWHGAIGARNAVFVQTDNPAGNQVVAYDRSVTGTLSLAGTYATGGLGGVLNGSAVDHLASQGSLAYNASQGLLYAVNAGSDSVSVFAARGDTLSLQQVVYSGGAFPVSVAVRGELVYVLNAENGANIAGFVSAFGHLFPLPFSNRNLGLTIPTDTTQFVNTPGQVAFSPSGGQLIVTTKANGSDIDVFGIGAFGLPSASPVVNDEPGTVPFAIAFDGAGHLVIANANTNALATYALFPNGTVSLIDAVGTGEAATCWVAVAGPYLYASNAGSALESGYESSAAGTLTLLGQTATDPGTVDAAATADGQFLYVQTGGNGIVDEFAVNGNGTLTPIGSVTVAGAQGGEGIVAF